MLPPVVVVAICMIGVPVVTTFEMSPRRLPVVRNDSVLVTAGVLSVKIAFATLVVVPIVSPPRRLLYVEVFEIVRAPEEATSKTLELFTSKLRKSPPKPAGAFTPTNVPEAFPS